VLNTVFYYPRIYDGGENRELFPHIQSGPCTFLFYFLSGLIIVFVICYVQLSHKNDILKNIYAELNDKFILSKKIMPNFDFIDELTLCLFVPNKFVHVYNFLYWMFVMQLHC
jgi:hypothetical protein